MPAAISVILPVANDDRSLPGCCAALMEGLEEGLLRELLVPDLGCQDDSLRIADAMGGTVLRGPDAVTQALAGARGSWLLILSPATRLARGWTVPVADHLAGSQRPVHFRLTHDAPGPRARLTNRWITARSALTGRAHPLQGLLVPRTLATQRPLTASADPLASLFNHIRGTGSLPAEIRVTG